MPSPAIRLTEIFVNLEILIRVLGIGGAEADRLYGLHEANRGSYRAGQVPNYLTEQLEANLVALGVEDLQRGLVRGSLREGDMVSIQQAFYCRRQRSESGAKMILMHGKLNTDNNVTLEMTVDPARLVSDSAHDHLSRRIGVYAIGIISSLERDRITLRPAFIGWQSLGITASSSYVLTGNETHYIHPVRIDQFSDVDFSRPLSRAELDRMAECAESQVKASILEILSETSVDKDWGGERSDAYTTQVSVDGERLRSAWLLKGKSVKRPMRVADLGKNGDQIDRLFSEPADFYVVQSNQQITSAVRNMLDIYAHDVRHPSLYTILDGQDTARILIAHDLLP